MFSKSTKSTVTRDEVRAIAEMSMQDGHIKADESRVLQNLLRLPELSVGDIMTPRTVVIAFDKDKSIQKCLSQHPHLPVTRIPIYQATIDHVVGFVLQYELLIAVAKGQGDQKIAEFRRELLHVHIKMSLTELFDVFVKQRQHIALVLDTHGGTAGVVHYGRLSGKRFWELKSLMKLISRSTCVLLRVNAGKRGRKLYGAYRQMGTKMNREALWAKRLMLEYEDIVWRYRLSLKNAVIEVGPLGGKWGEWNPSSRTIRISQELISSHSWSVVIEILKHEMAHQFVHEKYRDQGAHGPLFKKICGTLGVANWASASYAQLPQKLQEWRGGGLPDHEEKILAKANKLMSLATSDNEHEAAVAMQKVQELYQKYNIDRLKSKQLHDYFYLVIPLKKKRIEAFISQILVLLNDYYFVRAVSYDLYDPKQDTTYKAFELMGNRANVLMAEYVYYFLLEQVLKIWSAHRRKNLGANRKSFTLGVLQGFSDKLRQRQPIIRRKYQDHETRDLIVQEDQNLEQYMRTRFPRLTSSRLNTAQIRLGDFQGGHHAGGKIVLNKPMSGAAKGFGGLLEG